MNIIRAPKTQNTEKQNKEHENEINKKLKIIYERVHGIQKKFDRFVKNGQRTRGNE